jgi:hypothetical protein
MGKKSSLQHRVSKNASASTAETIAELANKHGSNLRALPFGFAFDAEKNVALAIWYLASFWRTNKKELQRIIRTGKTPFIEFLIDVASTAAEVTGYPKVIKTDEPFNLPFKIYGKDVILDFSDGPHLMKLTTLSTIQYNNTTITLDYENTERVWIKRVLKEGLTAEEQKMIEGTSMLGSKTQRKLGSKLSKLMLKLDDVAKSLAVSASKTSNVKHRDQIISWLTTNGFSNEASAVVIKSTLITRQTRS